MARNSLEEMQSLNGHQMLTNRELSVLVSSTALNLNWRKELEISQVRWKGSVLVRPMKFLRHKVGTVMSSGRYSVL